MSDPIDLNGGTRRQLEEGLVFAARELLDFMDGACMVASIGEGVIIALGQPEEVLKYIVDLDGLLSGNDTVH